MGIVAQIRDLLRLTRSQGIARRYFITNGFDGALTMLGLTMGFYVSGGVAPAIAVSACAGAAIALGMSGVTSAYVSEAAERRRELRDLQGAMVADLGESTHARAARVVPFLIAFVNGFAPLAISVVVILPLWLAAMGVGLPADPLELAIGLAFAMIFLLGVFLGRISGTFWLWTGLRTLLIGLVTALIILVLDI